MARLILGLFLFAVLALAMASGLTLARALRAPRPSSREVVPMPGAVRIVATIVLLLLLLGVTSGLLGPN